MRRGRVFSPSCGRSDTNSWAAARWNPILSRPDGPNPGQGAGRNDGATGRTTPLFIAVGCGTEYDPYDDDAKAALQDVLEASGYDISLVTLAPGPFFDFDGDGIPHPVDSEGEPSNPWVNHPNEEYFNDQDMDGIWDAFDMFPYTHHASPGIPHLIKDPNLDDRYEPFNPVPLPDGYSANDYAELLTFMTGVPVDLSDYDAIDLDLNMDGFVTFGEIAKVSELEFKDSVSVALTAQSALIDGNEDVILGSYNAIWKKRSR